MIRAFRAHCQIQTSTVEPLTNRSWVSIDGRKLIPPATRRRDRLGDYGVKVAGALWCNGSFVDVVGVSCDLALTSQSMRFTNGGTHAQTLESMASCYLGCWCRSPRRSWCAHFARQRPCV